MCKIFSPLDHPNPLIGGHKFNDFMGHQGMQFFFFFPTVQSNWLSVKAVGSSNIRGPGCLIGSDG